jgi:hypothetical protein
LTVVLCAVGMAATGCAKALAEAAPDGPPLRVPAPPARLLGPVGDPPPLPAEVLVPAVPMVAPVAPRPPTLRPAPITPDVELRPEPVVPEPVVADKRELQAAPNVAVAERTVRELLARATRDLSMVDYGRLTLDGKSQYDQSKRFAQQAEQALGDRNYVFAGTLADKAAALAVELLGN